MEPYRREDSLPKVEQTQGLASQPVGSVQSMRFVVVCFFASRQIPPHRTICFLSPFHEKMRWTPGKVSSGQLQEREGPENRMEIHASSILNSTSEKSEKIRQLWVLYGLLK